MDFELDDEQQALRDAVRGLLKVYDPATNSERRREVTATDPGYDEDLWGRMAEMGLLGLPFAEDDGGMGAGPVEVALVAEEIGRVLAPEPYVAAVVLASGLVAELGSDEQRAEVLGGVASGERLLTFASGEVAEPVIQGARADTIVWEVGGQVFLVDRPEGVTGYRTHDGGRAALLEFDRSRAIALGAGGFVDPVLRKVRARAQIAACHEAVGAMEAALALTTSYLTTRQQFGVTLNRFQALTFRAADMYTDLELTRSIVTWATLVAADGDEDALGDAAARAKLQTIRAARRIGQEAIQLHGGIGVTDEYSVGHFTSRLTALSHWLGDAREQLSTLSAGLTRYGVLDPLD
ncbi:acyl-CoA dehydrogenase family protein [Nocardioides marmorisolisilvae]|uniref:Acyl-CoA dehydrogenase n=1 Tax=Nocardioides marmorisolisilvae TaxID=1542737 RepID=A0A3N0DTR8_9ACTN|nr:acyl-CoA dehydrogenase family protein [Nocardioides marmorisolisilvae]RNL78793.1 acyl-CoA dehydrogenase [Nocardioides marmorisolisilvae]